MMNMTHKRILSGPAASRGFTLIELMVTILIATILISIALPTYTSQVRKSRRAEAVSTLLDLAGREERLFSTTNTYSNSPASLGYTGAAFPITVGSGYYQVSVTVTAAAPPQPATYTITATPIGAQADDTDCASFSLNQTGKQTVLDSGGADATATCWR